MKYLPEGREDCGPRKDPIPAEKCEKCLLAGTEACYVAQEIKYKSFLANALMSKN